MKVPLDEKTFQMPFWKDNGFKRQKCKHCGKHFYSVVERQDCGDPPCSVYTFIGKPVIPKKVDLKTIRKELVPSVKREKLLTREGRNRIIN